METKEQLNDLRQQIDDLDERIVSLFVERMAVSKKAAALKTRNNLAITDPAREQQIADRSASLAGETLKGEATLLMRTVMALSRGYQRKLLFGGEAPLLPPARKAAPENIAGAFQGVPGAWSEEALAKMFPEASRQPEEGFEDVFLAVKEGRVDYGVVPIENSKTGAIGETYDLLRKYGCFIVGQIWVDIRHCLMAPEGVSISDIREVLSHPEGFKQCRDFLRGRAWDLTSCRNTALAAQMAARAGNGRTAAIGSRRAAQLHGLTILEADIMDAATNRTSFVAIALAPEYDDRSNVVSVTFSTAHRSGALCETLLPFMAQGINLMRIESRPAALGNYRFFVDMEGNIADAHLSAALRQAASACEYFEVIGCYRNG
jgi:chorismate mutase/prephenate dehydratase